MPTPADFPELARSLLDTFGDGWARQNITSLLSVFAEDAQFREAPFDPPRKGLSAIREYWQDIAYHQSEGTFQSGEIFAVGPWFAAEFKCLFRRRRTGQWVDVRGAVFCETEGDKISEMRMYWHRRVGAQVVSNG